MSSLSKSSSINSETVGAAYESVFAPWVKKLGLKDIEVGSGSASALLPQTPDIQFFTGAICGQAIMAAVDTVASLAIFTSDRQTKGTASQTTQFLRPAVGEDLRITTEVLKFGATIAYAETRVTSDPSGELVAHATSEFVF
jgi:uncharacterized protein (TIGR00369 family)